MRKLRTASGLSYAEGGKDFTQKSERGKRRKGAWFSKKTAESKVGGIPADEKRRGIPWSEEYP